MKKQKPSLSYLQKQGGHLTNVISDSEIYHKKNFVYEVFITPQCINKIVKTVWPHPSGRPLRINLMSRYICFSQNGGFDVSFEELVSKAKNPGGFLRKTVF